MSEFLPKQIVGLNRYGALRDFVLQNRNVAIVLI
jgi:hypothetical protein